VAKPKFNPDVLKDRTPSGGLKPLDFMRPMEEEAAPEDTSPPEPAPPAEESPTARENVRTPERKRTVAATRPAPVERPMFLTPVDTSEKPFNQGFHMYPSRHRQLRDLAYIEDRRPWEVVEQALAEYVERHYSRQGREQRQQ
jgi:hypothetical protein